MWLTVECSNVAPGPNARVAGWRGRGGGRDTKLVASMSAGAARGDPICETAGPR